MTAEYKLYIDWDRDGYICRGVQPGDPLNLIKGALHKSGAYAHVQSPYMASLENEAVFRSYGEHDSGLITYRALRTNVNGNVNGVVLGATAADVSVIPSNIAYIAVPTPDVLYSVRVWVRVKMGSTDLILRVWRQDASVLLNATYSVTPGVWTEISNVFTATGATHVALGVMQDEGIGDFEIRGWMLVQGTTMPAAFNAGDPTNAYDDVSVSVRDAISFTDGLPYGDDFAAPSQLLAALDNRNGWWTPANPLSPVAGEFHTGLMVVLDALRGGITYPLWRGTLARLSPRNEDAGDPVVLLEAEDGALWLTDSEYTPRFMENVRTDEALRDVFDTASFIYPYAGAFGILDAPGASELNENFTLFEERITDFRQGDTVLPYAGDNLDRGEGVNTQMYLRDILACEAGGRLFYDAPRGKYVFHNRLRDAEETPLQRYSDTVMSIRPDNLLAYWKLGDLSGSIAADSSGNARHGTYTNVTLNSGTFVDGTPAAYFNGTNAYVDIYSAIQAVFRGEYGALSMWVKVDSSAVWTGSARIALNIQGSTQIFRLLKPATVTVLRGSWLGNAREITTTATGWIHLGAIWNADLDYGRIFVNGFMLGSEVNGAGRFTEALLSTGTVIGAGSTSSFAPWHGNIAHVALWDTPLSPHEIYTLATQSEWVQPGEAIAEWTPGAPLDTPPPDWSWGDDVVNQVDLNYESRTIGTPGAVVYAHENLPFNLDAGARRTVRARYTSPDTETQIAVKDGLTPVRGVDMVGNYTDGGMEDATDILSVFAAFAANTAEITVVNFSERPVAVTTLQLRGTPVLHKRGLSVRSREPGSIAQNGLRKLALNIVSIHAEEFAQQYADLRARQQSQPIKQLRRIAFRADAHEDTEDAILGMRVGDWLNVDTGDGAARYVVLARQHTIAEEVGEHSVVYTVKALVRTSVLILDSPLRGRLDSAVIGL